MPAPDEVLNKYLQAAGGTQKLTTLTSFVAKGGYQGYDDLESSPVEIYAKGFRTIPATQPRSQWRQDFRRRRPQCMDVSSGNGNPVPVLGMDGGDLQGLHFEAQLFFPARIKQLLTNLRVGYPLSGTLSILPDEVGTQIDDRQLTVMQGTTVAGGLQGAALLRYAIRPPGKDGPLHEPAVWIHYHRTGLLRLSRRRRNQVPVSNYQNLGRWPIGHRTRNTRRSECGDRFCQIHQTGNPPRKDPMALQARPDFDIRDRIRIAGNTVCLRPGEQEHRLRLSVVGIVVKDYAKSQDFYGNKMGLREAFKFANQDGTRTTTYYQLGRDTFLEMRQAAGDVPPGFTHVHLAVDDLNATSARLRQAGVPGSARGATTAGTLTEAGMAQPSNVKNGNLIEPDGLRLELNELIPESLTRKAANHGSKKQRLPAGSYRYCGKEF